MTDQQQAKPTVQSAANVLRLVRQQMLIDAARIALFLALLLLLHYGLSGSFKYLPLASVLFVLGVVHMYIGEYVPVSNRHDSLLNRYGDRYVKEVAAAVQKHGVRKLISTKWFETYADDLCERS